MGGAGLGAGGGRGGVAHPAKSKAMAAAKRRPRGFDLKRDKAKMFIPVLGKSDGSCEQILAATDKTVMCPKNVSLQPGFYSTR
jgi:hypothetical protein